MVENVLAIRVTDDVLLDPDAYRAAALALPFTDIEAGPIVFHGMAAVGSSPLSVWLEAMFGLHTTYSAFRQSPAGQVEPHLIHDDRSMGEWSAILYLTPDPPHGDGTCFYESRQTGARVATTMPGTDDWLATAHDWFDQDRWACWRRVDAKFNRVVVFPSACFHARAIPHNYGTVADGTARLIQIAFGDEVLS